MKITPVKNTYISFSARKQDIKKADKIQRLARENFPMLSVTYMDTFYLSHTSKNSNAKLRNRAEEIIKKTDDNIKIIRENASSNKNNIESTSPYAKILKYAKLMKVGNCDEAARTVLATLAANGYYNSKLASLGIQLDYINKSTGNSEYKGFINADHIFVLTALDKVNPNPKDEIVIDSWMGFADSKSGAIDRYKSIFNQKKLEAQLSYHYSMFRLMEAEKGNGLINPDDYKLETKYTFYYDDVFPPKDMKKLGLYAKKMYPRLVINK